ncbi:hypothetical protein DM02DRAFT_632180 [Periconia macrospinosa]|uniref:Uncharacterized protein n=1 Tax=Periconia macrospinosa TaxID=97972 RepID=A0A2V1DE02_9PLEO|nr:hypothetical protein DM02DRAFT_632180 [Periconia macrospinosa]
MASGVDLVRRNLYFGPTRFVQRHCSIRWTIGTEIMDPLTSPHDGRWVFLIRAKLQRVLAQCTALVRSLSTPWHCDKSLARSSTPAAASVTTSARASSEMDLDAQFDGICHGFPKSWPLKIASHEAGRVGVLVSPDFSLEKRRNMESGFLFPMDKLEDNGKRWQAQTLQLPDLAQADDF